MQVLVASDDEVFRRNLFEAIRAAGIRGSDIVSGPGYLQTMLPENTRFDVAFIEWAPAGEFGIRELRGRFPGICIVAFCKGGEFRRVTGLANIPVEIGAEYGRDSWRLCEIAKLAVEIGQASAVAAE